MKKIIWLNQRIYKIYLSFEFFLKFLLFFFKYKIISLFYFNQNLNYSYNLNKIFLYFKSFLFKRFYDKYIISIIILHC